MSDRVRCYLAGLCHGIATVWIVAYVLYKSSVPISGLLGPRGVLQVGLALPVALASIPLLLGLRRGASEGGVGRRG